MEAKQSDRTDLPVVLVTGASSGIGREFALRFARLGHPVFAVGRDAAALGTLAAEAGATGGTVTVCVADLSTRQGVEQVVLGCPAPGIVVANAGTTVAARVGTAPWAELESLGHLIGAGVAQLVEATAPAMAERGGGDIIIVSSIASLVRMPGSAVYAAAKSYATAYGRSIHRELRPKGVRVCVVCPGYVRTPLHDRSGLAHLRRRVPGWMWIEPEDVVDAALRGLRRGRAVVVPGWVYRLSLPFLNSSVAQRVWATMTRRTGRAGQASRS